MVLGGIEERREPRTSRYWSIEFYVKSRPGQPMKGIGTNVSKSGLGIFSFVPLIEGQEISIMKEVPPATHAEYTVRWSKKLVEDFFMVGLTTETPEAPPDVFVK
jgi:hypothetical protein